MRILSILLLVFSLLAAAACTASGEDDIASKVKALDSQVQASFGVSLAALPMIADATSGGYFPVDMLESAGKWGGFKELEKAGYLRIEVMSGLPDGTNSGVRFARFVLTPRGEELRAALLGV